MSTALAKILKLALLGCVIALGAVRSADAAVIVINADPKFGDVAPFDNLSWKALGVIYVPPACVADLPTSATTIPNNCFGLEMQFVKVGFYKYGDATETILDTLMVGTYLADTDPPTDGSNLLTQKLTGAKFDSEDKLVDFTTSLSMAKATENTQNSQDVVDFEYLNDYLFSLEFSFDTARLVAFGSGITACEAARTEEDRRGNSPDPCYSQFLAAESTYEPTFRIGALVETLDPNALEFSVAPRNVPEPGSLTLVGLALCAAALGLRRSRG
jgi:hypothetical protein